MSTPTITPFTLHVDDAQVAALRDRLATTRWPSDADGIGWDHGTPVEYARELADHWRTAFDWRAQETRINAVPQFTTPVDGHDIHFFHVRSPHPGATPLLLVHGWPGSPTEFLPMIDALVDPTSHGGAPEDAFDVVVPTIPGFGVSGPARGWDPDRAAGAFVELMSALGYGTYAVHGYDTGASIARTMGLRDPDHVLGVHVTSLFGDPLTYENADLSAPDEQRALESAALYEYELGGYALVQATRPQSLALPLTDSPVGLMTWLVERFKDWSACAESPEEVFTRDDMLTIVSTYWFFGTIGSSMRYYKEGSGAWGARPERSDVPTACCILPQDMGTTVRRMVEPYNRIVRWTELPAGGHFAAWEQPDLLVDDLRASLATFRERDPSITT